MILNEINKNNKITQIELAQKLKVSRRTIQREIRDLRELCFLDRIGTRKSGKWVIKS